MPGTLGIQPVPLAEMVEDFSAYPRHHVDNLHVHALADALRAGASLPPVILDAATKRIVDGFHRTRAYRIVNSETASIDAELREYSSEADFVLDAIRLNSSHGRRLDKVDMVRAANLAQQAGATTVQIGLVLNIPEPKVERFIVRTAIVPGPPPPGAIDGRLPLKRSASHMAGMILTPAQVEAHRHLIGCSLLVTTRQLRMALESDLANRDDTGLIAELRLLQPVISQWMEGFMQDAA